MGYHADHAKMFSKIFGKYISLILNKYIRGDNEKFMFISISIFCSQQKNDSLLSDQILRSKSSRELFNILYIFFKPLLIFTFKQSWKSRNSQRTKSKTYFNLLPNIRTSFFFLLLNRVSILIDFPGKIKERHIGKKYETFGHGDETHRFFIVSNDSQERSRPTSKWRRFHGHV